MGLSIGLRPAGNRMNRAAGFMNSLLFPAAPARLGGRIGVLAMGSDISVAFNNGRIDVSGDFGVQSIDAGLYSMPLVRSGLKELNLPAGTGSQSIGLIFKAVTTMNPLAAKVMLESRIPGLSMDIAETLGRTAWGRKRPSLALPALAIAMALSAFSPMALTGCRSTAGEKSAMYLSDSEQGAVNSLLMSIYEKSPDLRAIATYETTLMLHPVTHEKLAKPIRTVSVGIMNPALDYTYPKWRDDLVDSLENMSVSWDENGRRRTLEIEEYHIENKHGGAGGGMGMTYDMITIYPLEVKISQ